MAVSLATVMDADPYRDPKWRYLRLREMFSYPDRTPLLPGPFDDEIIRTAREFILRKHNAESRDAQRKLACNNLGLWYAYKIFETSLTDPTVAFAIEARILARQTDRAIAKQASTNAAVINWYEKLFFNVRERLENRDYIVRTVIAPSYTRSIVPEGTEEEFARAAMGRATRTSTRRKPAHEVSIWMDGTVKLFGYMGGAYVLEPYLNNCHFDTMPVSVAHAENWIDDYWDRTLRRRASQGSAKLGINKHNIGGLLNLHAQIQMKKQLLGGATDPEAAAELERFVTDASLSFLSKASGGTGRAAKMGGMLPKQVESRSFEMLAEGGTRGPDNTLYAFPPPTKNNKGQPIIPPAAPVEATV